MAADTGNQTTLMRTTFTIIILITLSLLTQVTQALEVTTLYEADTLIEVQTKASQKAALQDTMKQVLVKVSGDRDVIKQAGIKSALKNVNEYVLQFRFVQRQQSRYIHAEFDVNKINRLILQAGLPLWGSRRPNVMLWLAFEQDNGFRKILADGDQSDTVSSINDTADLRGLPLMLPLVDMSDVTNIGVVDVWGRFVGPAEQASQRYAADGVVVARMFQGENLQMPSQILSDDFDLPFFGQEALMGEEEEVAEDEASQTAAPSPADDETEQTPAPVSQKQWQLDWRMEVDQHVLDQRIIADTAEQAVAQLIDAVADFYASSYAISSQGDGFGEYRLYVNNVSSIQRLVAIEEYLNSLTEVGDVMLETVDAERMGFKLTLIGRRADVRQALGLSKKLRLQERPIMPLDPRQAPLHESTQMPMQQDEEVVDQYVWITETP